LQRTPEGAQIPIAQASIPVVSARNGQAATATSRGLMTHDQAFRCRGCGNAAPRDVVVSFGTLPLGNSLLAEERLAEPEPAFPLDLVFCSHCALVQVREAIPLDALIKQNLYFTSASPALLQHGRVMAQHLIDQRRLAATSLVVDVGSNDGTLLEYFQQRGIPVLGIEPLAQSAKIAEDEHGVPTVVELFTNDLAKRLKSSGKTADVIIANYVLELVPDLPDFVDALRTLLKPEGVAVIEVPYVRSMVEQGRFDAIAHLRLTWFSVTSVDHLCRSRGLTVVDMEYLPAFRGGTLRIYASASPTASTGASTATMLRDEAQSGMTSADFYRQFGRSIHSSAEELHQFLRRAKSKEGKRIAAYSAGIKASTLLNVAKLDEQLIDFVVDGNPHKHGRYMPGVHLRVEPPVALLERMPDYTLLLALDFVDEILEQQSEYRQRGGRFIIPFPKLKLI
jgi:SAM-dependent methyltransferase